MLMDKLEAELLCKLHMVAFDSRPLYEVIYVCQLLFHPPGALRQLDPKLLLE